MSDRFEIYEGDAREVLGRLEPESIDAVITDPPYGVRDDGETWNADEIAAAADHVARREGASGRRQSYRKGETTLRNMHAGKYDLSRKGMSAFQQWTERWARASLLTIKPGAFVVVFASPRTYHRMVSGLEDAGLEVRDCFAWLFAQGVAKSSSVPVPDRDLGTGLRPVHEPIALTRKRPEGTVKSNVLQHGSGAIDLGATRFGDGMYPTNVVVSHHPDCRGYSEGWHPSLCHEDCPALAATRGGSLAPFFYCAKVAPTERIAGSLQNLHPTVKPVGIMRWLIRLVVPPGGVVVDPFMGSGSTGCAALTEGRRFVGIERDPGYAQVARERLADWAFAHPVDVV